MDILISFTAKVAECMVAPIGRQAGYLLFYKGNFKKLADHVKELEAARERMNHSIEEEKRNGKEIENDVTNWLEEVTEVIEKANRLQKDPDHAKVGCSSRSFPNLILHRQLSMKATKISKEVIKVQGKGNFDRVGYLPALDGVAFSISSTTRGGVKLDTRDSYKEDILKALKDPNACNIGVYGLGGVGKTTLVKEVAEIAKRDKLFDVVVIAHVSKTPDIRRIQGEIADLLHLRFDEETVAGRAYRLRQRIIVEKTILVILDDIWTILDLEEVGIPYGDAHNGCKLLMTSRNKEVLQEMDVDKDFTIRLELLSEAETWILFQSMAGDVVEDIGFQTAATQVAKKCAGLPLGIVTVARALRNKDINAWEDALRQLESVDHAEIDAKIYSVLELSYNSLESDEMKTLFLLFAVLEEGTEYFLNVAMSLDIFKGIHTMRDARNRLHKIIESLKASCLLLEGNRGGQIQMHDSVREVAISIASRDQHVFVVKPKDELKDWPTNDFLKSCSQIILDRCHIHELPQLLDCPNAKLFILCSNDRSLEIPDTVFEGMRNLKVLDLTFLNLSSLPTSIWSLTDLQTLCLERCVLENTDAIGALKNLEFLSLRKSSMIKLPSEIRKMTQLRMLDLSDSGIEAIPPNIISNLTRLEELKMGNTLIKWVDENSAKQNEHASLVELRHLSNLSTLELQIHEAWIFPRDLNLMFEKLKRYKIAIGDVWEWSDIKDGTSKTLMLKLGTNIHLEHGIKALIKGIQNLYLDEVDGIQNVLYQLNGEGFPLLKQLHIQNNSKMKHIVDSLERNLVQISFLNLETLVLHNLKNLEQICHGPLAVHSFSKLRVIKVKNCIHLRYLLSFSVVKGLSQLFEIEVCKCNSLKGIVLRDSNSSADNEIISEKIEFLSLRALTLEHLQTLDNFFSYDLTSSITEQRYQGSKSCVSALFSSAQIGNMAKGKGQGAEPSQGGKEILRWTDDMDQILLNALMEEANKGNRHDGAWTTEAYSNVVDALRSRVAPTMTKQHIKNRMKTLKDHFAESYDLFGSLSGFAWNPMTRRFEAEDEVWQDLIKEKPHATKWKTMQIKHYDVLRELFGLDRAGGKKSGTHRMRRKEKEKEKENNGERDNIDLNDSIDDDAYIPEFDTGVFYERREEPPNVDSYSPAGGVSHYSFGTSGSRGTKRKAPMTDLMEDQLERMTSGIGLMADALNKGNAISNQLHDVEKQQIAIAERQVAAIEKRNEILQHSRPRVYTASDVWDMLSELNLLEQFRLQCYEFLCSNDKKKELVFGVPTHLRLQVLFQIMNVTGHHVGNM